MERLGPVTFANPGSAAVAIGYDAARPFVVDKRVCKAIEGARGAPYAQGPSLRAELLMHTLLHVPMRRRHLRLSLLLSMLVVVSCECGPDLNVIPEPSAKLVYQQQEAPPLELLEIDVGVHAVGAGGGARFAVQNVGGATLNVSQVVLASDPALCPSVSAAFHVDEPSQAFALPGRATEADAPAGKDVVVSFQPTDGTPACAIVEVHSDDEVNPVLRALVVGQGDAPRLCTSTPSIDFGAVFLGDTKEDTVTLESCGTRPITIADVVAGDAFPPFAFEAPPAGTSLPPGEVLSIPVSFTPDVERTWSFATNNAGLLTVTTDDPSGQAYQVGLEGVGVREPSCRLLVVPSALSFGTVASGFSSTQQLVVRNAGELDCTLDGIAVRAPAGSFAVDLTGVTLPAALAPGDLVTVSVSYAPASAAGAENGFLDVTSSDPVRPSIEVPLEGLSVEPQPCMLQAAPSAVNFGNQPLNRTSEREVTFTNVGTEGCSLKSLTLTTGAPDFGVIASLFPFIGTFVSPGGTASARVTFRPTANGTLQGNLRATFNEMGLGNPSQTLDVPLLGNGVPPAICVSPTSVDFGSVNVGASADETVQIANCGSAPLELRGLSLRGGTHPDFSIETTPALPRMLDAGVTVSVTVRAAPTNAGIASAGAAMYGALEVLSDDPDDPAVPVPLVANGDDCQGLVCTPLPLDFGVTPVGLSLVRALTCQNPGVSAVTVSPSIAAPFEVVSAPASIAAGGVGVVVVRYTPAGAGVDNGSLLMGANGCTGAPLSVGVVGEGAMNTLPVCPTPQAFTPDVVWHWEGGTTLPASKQVWVTPLVSRLEDTTGDGRVTRDDMPRVVFISFNHDDFPGITDTDHVNDPVPGVLRAVDGATGAEVFTNTNEEHRLNSSVNLALADIDADGLVEIIGQSYVVLEGVETIENGPKLNGKFAYGQLIAFEHDGTFKWKSDEWTRSSDELEDTGGIAVADIDGDGFGEIAVGDHVYDHNGSLLWAGGEGTGSTGHGPVSVFAELDGQPGLELVAGRTAYRNDGSVLWNRDDIYDALPAVADLDGDGFNEVVLRSSKLYVVDGMTGADLTTPKLPPTHMSMPDECVPASDPEAEEDCNPIPTNPAIMEVNGQPGLEIAVANTEVLIVYDASLNELWRAPIGDFTGASGPIGFDFESDGKVNVTYSDESNVWVYDALGDDIYDAARRSVTMMETITVADIDNDGHANVLAGSNEPQLGTADGLDALSNSGVSWTHARGLWNQHAYVEALVGELGTLMPPSSIGALPGFRIASAACE